MRATRWMMCVTAAAVCAAGACAETVSVDPAVVEVPRWQGWGCSLSWWATFSRHWSDGARRDVCRRVFAVGPDSLGFTICRYNAGGTAATADAQPFRPGADVRAMLDQDGSWHPDRDRAQLECMRLARKFGADTFELFVNSPPYWMLRNGNTRGDDKGGENLRRDQAQAYAEWVVATAVRAQKAAGVRFRYLAPFNEPSAWWWNAKTSGQEGCRLTWGAQAEALRALKAAIGRSGQPFRIACSDENGATEAYHTLEWLTADDQGNWSGGGLGADTIQKLNVHAYNGWDWQERLRDLAASHKIPELWMSEVSRRESDDAGFVPNDMRCALPTTRSIVSDIKRLRCSAWIHWQPTEPLQFGLWYRYTYGFLPAAVDKDVEWNGRVYHPGEYVVTKAFHAMRQFSAFIRPGDALVRSGDEWTLSALSRDRRKLTLVIHNDSTSAKRYTFDLARFGATGATARIWRTADDAGGATFNCRELPRIPVHSSRFVDAVPARSVTTYVVDVAPSR